MESAEFDTSRTSIIKTHHQNAVMGSPDPDLIAGAGFSGNASALNLSSTEAEIRLAYARSNNGTSRSLRDPQMTWI